MARENGRKLNPSIHRRKKDAAKKRKFKQRKYSDRDNGDKYRENGHHRDRRYNDHHQKDDHSHKNKSDKDISRKHHRDDHHQKEDHPHKNNSDKAISRKRHRDDHKSEPKSREEVLNEQKKDKQELQKNKRMFGFVAGLLEKFDRSNNNKLNNDMRIEIESKIEEREEKERIDRKRQKVEKAEERHKKDKLKTLQSEKAEKVFQFETWEKSQKSFDHCILTQAKAPIYYVPAEHNSQSRERLKETQSMTRLKIAEERVKHQKVLDELDVKIKHLEKSIPAASTDKSEGKRGSVKY